MRRLLVPLAILALGWTACPPPQPIPPEPLQIEASVDSAPVVYGDTDCGHACTKLAELGCEEATTNCEAVCSHVLATGITAFDPFCITNARTRESVRVCPAIRCR